ncbi:hypothetical protein P409_00920 [Inquilinus limosus MP06]|uniref:Uncharacterized protein n=2 Tax=Inquilinus limosus TaxID=171674 RepID=A0A0A0DBG7_9PROT|nr:hypothetical protein P409_00920 [Inquilinus limosus MP06]
MLLTCLALDFWRVAITSYIPTRCDLDMPDTDVFRLRQSNLNAFLFADVGAESNGMPLSVVSMLGRLGGDPWVTAGRLAGQPRDAAVLELAEIITGTAQADRSSGEIMAIAARLASLLPSVEPRTARRAPLPGTQSPAPGRWSGGALAVLVLAAVAAALLLRVVGLL